jgi:hypothetical protein
MGVASSGWPYLLILVQFGIIVFLFLRNRSLSREAIDLHHEANRLTRVADEQHEQIITQRRMYQGRIFLPIERPRRVEKK